MTNKIKNLFNQLKKRLRSKKSDDHTPSTPLDESLETYSLDSDEFKKETLLEKIKEKISLLKAKYDGKKLKPFSSTTGEKNLKENLNLTLLSPRLNQLLDRALHHTSRTLIHQFFLISLIASLSYSFGKISALLVAGHPQIDSSKDFEANIDLTKSFDPARLSVVKSSNIFKTNTGLNKQSNADIKCETAQNQSKLPIKLVNTVVLQDSIKSIASVQVRGDRKLEEIREGDVISNMAKVFKIDRLELIIKNLENGVCESISSSKGELTRNNNRISVMSKDQARDFLKNKKISGIDNQGNKFNISKNLLDDKLKDIASILTQARAIKIQNNDGSLSFKLTEIDPEGIFPYLGLQDEDIITSINGKPIYDMNEVMTLFGKIKTLDNLSLGVRREGSDSIQEYSIKK
jgi:type II secretion system protein C